MVMENNYQSLMVIATIRINDFSSSIKIDELANRYLETDNDLMREAYVAAILLKKWHLIRYFNNKYFNLGEPLEKFYDFIYDATLKVLKGQYWVNKEDLTFESCLNKAIETTILTYYQQCNNNKRKVNYESNNVSLDETVFDDKEISYGENIADDEDAKPDSVDDIIERYLRKSSDENNKIDFFKALILDGILYADCFLDDKKLVSYDEYSYDEEGNETITREKAYGLITSFSKLNLYKHLLNLKTNDDFIQYFSGKYHVNENYLRDYINSFSANSLRNNLAEAFKELSEDKELKESLRN